MLNDLSSWNGLSGGIDGCCRRAAGVGDMIGLRGSSGGGEEY
jgi:hypothetical protein